jgi:hypothetical protein
MSGAIHSRLPAGLAAFALAMSAPPLAAAHSAGAASQNGHASCGTREHPIEVVLPFEIQANLFHSLPIAGLLPVAGLLVTPEAIAERVLTNPLRATTDPPLTGNGGPHPVGRSGVVATHADPPD